MKHHVVKGNMTQREPGPRVSSSFEAFSTVLSTLVDVTLFFRGCFECTHPQKDEDRGGTWFDQSQVRRDQNFCYVNPTLVEPNGEVVHLKKRSSKSYVASTLDEIPYGSVNPVTHTQPIPNGFHSSSDLYVKSKAKFLYRTGPKSSSFAVSVEKEYLGTRNEFIRYDGNSFQQKLRPLYDKEPKRQKMESPILHRRLMQIDMHDSERPWDSVSLDSIDEEDLRVEREKVFGDVWRSCELEDIFGDYNDAAFRSFGSVSTPFQKKIANAKPCNEKFEDIFPSKRSPEPPDLPIIPSPVESNHNVDTESDFTCSRTSTVSNISALKFVGNTIEFRDLMDLIKESIFMDCSDDLEEQSLVLKKCDFFCDSNFVVNGKSFNPLLIFDLVKQMMRECRRNYYPYSIALSTALHTETVQYLALNVIEFPILSDGSNTDDCSDRKPQEIDAVPGYIEKLATEEMKLETRVWHSFEHEEELIKEYVYEDICDELLSSEAEFLMNIFNRKIQNIRS